MALVYKITNSANGKVYIGFTSRTLHERWIEHTAPCRLERQTRLYKAIEKYGKDSFQIEVLENFNTTEEALTAERKYITKFNSYKQGYNDTLGGDKQVFTPEIKAKISLAKMGHLTSEQTRKKISNTLSKTWSVVIKGNEYITDNLKCFCKEHNINYYSLVRRRNIKRKNIYMKQLNVVGM